MLDSIHSDNRARAKFASLLNNILWCVCQALQWRRSSALFHGSVSRRERQRRPNLPFISGCLGRATSSTHVARHCEYTRRCGASKSSCNGCSTEPRKPDAVHFEPKISVRLRRPTGISNENDISGCWQRSGTAQWLDWGDPKFFQSELLAWAIQWNSVEILRTGEVIFFRFSIPIKWYMSQIYIDVGWHSFSNLVVERQAPQKCIYLCNIEIHNARRNADRVAQQLLQFTTENRKI